MKKIFESIGIVVVGTMLIAMIVFYFLLFGYIGYVFVQTIISGP